MEIRHVSKEEVLEVLAEFREKRPENAEQTFTKGQLIFAVLVVIVCLASLWLNLFAALVSFIAVCVLGFTTLAAAKTFLTVESFRKGMIDFPAEELANIDRENLPVYTILVPLMGEESVVQELVGYLSQLDYPPEKLQIMLLLEERDPKTIGIVCKMNLPTQFEIYLMADAGPRTKPKACTIAMKYVRGEFCVIFDAEDRPESDQLLKVVRAYGELPEDVWCIQAKLEYYNIYQNLLTRLFSGEYVSYFNLILPGLAAHDLLVPLGGTSNHFRTHRLLQMGGWDAWNVTEDLDLGVEIKKRGGNVGVVNSVTWEEAMPMLRLFQKGGWTAQRSRWIKGPMQTWLVHMRNPLRLLQQLGLKNFVFFQLLVGGTPAALMLSPVFLSITALYATARLVIPAFNPALAMNIQLGIESLFPAPVFYLGALSFAAGNILLVYYALWGCMYRGLYANTKWMLLAPFYWLLMSFAAWKAFWQLIVKPHHWEKSQHGVSHQPTQPTQAATPVAETLAVRAHSVSTSTSEGD